MRHGSNSPFVNGVPPASSLVGSGLTKTLDVGGSRFGAWSAGGFSPVSYVQTTTARPIVQLSAPPTYPQLPTYAVNAMTTPAQHRAVNATPWSPRSPVFWVVAATAGLLVLFVLKRKKVLK